MNDKVKLAWTTPAVVDLDLKLDSVEAGMGPAFDGPTSGTSDFS